MQEKHIIINNYSGLHCRPCSEIVNQAKKFNSEIIITKGEEKANGKSMMDLVVLTLKQGDIIKVFVEGEDEDKAIEVIANFLSKKYDFPE